MIELTRLNGSILFLNPDLLYTIEATPDTILKLTNDEVLVVAESPAEVIARFEAHKQRILRGPEILIRQQDD
jgi:flagellar protein FlbD